MNHLNPSHPASRAKRPTSALVVVLALFASIRTASAQVPAELQGTWVPVKATCESGSSVVVGADQVTLVNGTDRQSIGGIEMAGPGYWPPDYDGIEKVLITEFDGQQPVTMTFNASEKKGVAQADFSPPMPGGNAAYNTRINQLNLAKRFPINKMSLKRCAAAGT